MFVPSVGVIDAAHQSEQWVDSEPRGSASLVPRHAGAPQGLSGRMRPKSVSQRGEQVCRARDRTRPLVDVSLLEPVAQRRVRDAEVLRDLCERDTRLTTTHDLNVFTKLLWIPSSPSDTLSSRANSLEIRCHLNIHHAPPAQRRPISLSPC